MNAMLSVESIAKGFVSTLPIVNFPSLSDVPPLESSISPILSSPLSLPIISVIYVACLIPLTLMPSPRLLHSSLFRQVCIVHNLCLSLMSIFLVVLSSLSIVSIWHYESSSSTICVGPNERMRNEAMVSFYIFFLSKLPELLDTILLMLRNRRLSLLHVWHHLTVPYQVYAWMVSEMVIGLYGMLFNSSVHVIMYYYYAAALSGKSPKFKQWITITQIIQFLTGFASLIPFGVYHLDKNGSGCKGIFGLGVAAFLNFTYLVLFVRYYMLTYKKKPNGKTA